MGYSLKTHNQPMEIKPAFKKGDIRYYGGNTVRYTGQWVLNPNGEIRYEFENKNVKFQAMLLETDVKTENDKEML